MKELRLNALIEGFLRGSLREEEEMQLLAWVKESEENKASFLEKQEILSKELSSHPDTTTRSKWNNFHSEIISKDKIRKLPISKKPVRNILAIAASFVLGIVIATALLTSFPVDSGIGGNIQEVSTPNGARTSFELPDGSKVWLNSGSSLSFPMSFRNKRPVTLVGEAFFDVKKNSNPFIVSTQYGKVCVKGTSFDVKAYNDESFETTLLTGSVEITGKNKDKVDLIPGFQAKSTNGKLSVSKVETEVYTSWKDGKLIFQNEPLLTVAKRLERWYNVNIELDHDPNLYKIKYNGTIEMESVTEVLSLLKITASIDYTYDKNKRLIKIFYNGKE